MKYINFVFFVCIVSPAMGVLTSFSLLYTYTFTPLEEMIIAGNIHSECEDASTWKKKDMAPGNDYEMTLALTEYQNNCWKDGRYNNGDYKVENGTIASSDNSKLYSAFKIYPPSQENTKFLGSKTVVYFSFPTGGDWKIYSFDGVEFSEEEEVTAVDNTLTKTSYEVARLENPVILFAVPKSTTITIWPVVNGVESATIFRNEKFMVNAQRFDVSASGTPFDPSKDWTSGPKSHSHKYGTTKRFFIVHDDGGNEGVVWQDPSSFSVYVTWLTKLSESNTVKLPSPAKNHYLEAAAGNNGEIAFIMLATEAAADDKVTPNSLKGYKVDKTGKILAEIDYDTSSKSLNIWKFFASGASMVWNTETNEIGLMISRTMTQGNDGLNHQGCIAVVLDGKDMSIIKNLGQTSGHSWSNSLGIGSNGKFFGADLGDNYPRGINLQEFDSQRKGSKVVYTFKTKHTTNENAYGKKWESYPEISNGETTYYKQSNDNDVYTEIAHNAAIEVNNGSAVLVIFAGEKPSLDNSQVGSAHNAPRNIAFVKVARDIGNKDVLSNGPSEQSGFYDFGGRWNEQENKGVNWLTSWDDKEEDNASRLKAVKIGDVKIGDSTGDMILVLFEKWTPTSYVSTQLMGLDEDGKMIIELTTSSYNFQIPYADELYATTYGSAIFYSGDSSGKLVRYEVGLSSDSIRPYIPGDTNNSSSNHFFGYVLSVVIFTFLLSL